MTPKPRANLTQARAAYLRKFRASPAYQQAIKRQQDDAMAWAGGTNSYIDYAVESRLGGHVQAPSQLQKLKQITEDGGASAEANRIIEEEYAKVGLPPPQRLLMTSDLPKPIWSLGFKEILEHCRAADDHVDEMLRRALVDQPAKRAGMYDQTITKTTKTKRRK